MSLNEKRKFGLIEHIGITYRASLSFLYNKLYNKQNFMNFKFKERIVLAVTEVNGCIMCSYVHTKLSLKAGLSNEDIKEILAGDLDGIPADESLAVLFAKDYAYNKETIDPAFYDKLEKTRQESKYLFGGRLATYQYLDMHVIVEQALKLVASELN